MNRENVRTAVQQIHERGEINFLRHERPAAGLFRSGGRIEGERERRIATSHFGAVEISHEAIVVAHPQHEQIEAWWIGDYKRHAYIG